MKPICIFVSGTFLLLETIPKDQVKIKTDKYSEEIASRLKSIDNGNDKLVSHADFWGKFDDRVQRHSYLMNLS